MSKGFGKSQRTKLDILSESAIRYCQQKYPEALDNIFDNNSLEFNHQLCDRVILALDIDTIAWFCAYLCSEINVSADNNKPYPIGKLDLLHNCFCGTIEGFRFYVCLGVVAIANLKMGV
ncbi:hypothetical protein [Anabaena sp. UHCC 0451]|uniref:hypothetical protein n=1 Tax=Anabaena sp. UHCC 0451 TaxID=2055235 RepID=UPI002B20A803|nr:hypothetical protein [Anabaena sp. UHCC 0451]MEA5578679.1 hypothetical protein [Anabaena sp. UHCC 0451]